MLKIAVLAALAASLAGCGSRSDGVNGGQIAAGVNQVYCPVQTQGRTEGDRGCVERPKPAPTQGRTN